MYIEFFAKLVTIAGSVFALYKLIISYAFAKKSRLRKEFTFTKKFIVELKSDAHPYIIEKGYLAMTGDSTLTAKEIIYLLSFPSPTQALLKYSVSKKYVEFSRADANTKAEFVFRQKYKTQRKRSCVKRTNVAMYIVFAICAFIPTLFANNIFATNFRGGLVVIVMALLSFGLLAIMALTEYAHILRAEELINMQ